MKRWNKQLTSIKITKNKLGDFWENLLYFYYYDNVLHLLFKLRVLIELMFQCNCHVGYMYWSVFIVKGWHEVLRKKLLT
jgi:hypothetical protein